MSAAALRRRPWVGASGPAGDPGPPDEPWPGPDWLPVQVRSCADADAVAGRPGRVVDWVRAPGLRPVEPFLDQTVDRLLRSDPETRTTGLGVLLRVPPALPVRGVVAHVSRCGSTLVGQWLAASPRRLVLSEPAVLDGVLRLQGVAREQHVGLVRGAIAALAQPRGGSADSAHLKLDAWSSLALDLVRAALPGVPVLALGRDPVEVLVSALRQRGAHMVPGALPPALFGLTAPELASLPPEHYAARVLAAVHRGLLREPLEAYLDHADLLASRERVLALLRAPQDGADLDAVSARHAKAPERAWVDDRADKQRAASPEVRAAVAEHVQALRQTFLDRAATTRWPA